MTQQELDKLFADLVGARTRQAFLEVVESLETAASEGEDAVEIAKRAEQLADDARAQVRGQAWKLVALARGAGALPLLERHLKDADAEARRELADAAIFLRKAGLPLLRALAADPTFEVRFLAGQGLAPFKDSLAFEPLVEGTQVADTRYEALTSLATLGDARAVEAVEKVFGKRFFVSDFERVRAAWTLAKLGKESAKSWLLERVKARKGEGAGVALEAVGELALAEAAVLLEAILADRAEKVFRAVAATALGAIGAPGALEKLSALLYDEAEEPAVRAGAAEGLGRLRTGEAKAALEKAKGIKEEEVQSAVQLELEFFDKPDEAP